MTFKAGISNKVIFLSFIFINLIQTARSADLENIYKSENNTKINLSNLKASNLLDSLLVVNSKKQNEIVIKSDKQSELNDVIYAEGNVSLSYQGKLLQADNLTYDKLNKEISARGNIVFLSGDQIFKASELEYSFISDQGYLIDVQGSISTSTLMEDLSSNFSVTDTKKIESLLKLEKKEALYTPNKINNWIFYTERIIIDGKKWKSNKAIFTNDILQSKQVKIEMNLLEAYPLNEELRFKSSLNYLVLDDKVSIPFWLGKRTLSKSENLTSKSIWTIGFDNLDKDGLFIGKKFNSINLSDDFIFRFINT